MMAGRSNRKERAPTGERPLAVNRKARRQFRVLERYEAGIALLGTEVKSIRAGKIQLRDSYVAFRDDQAWLQGRTSRRTVTATGRTTSSSVRVGCC